MDVTTQRSFSPTPFTFPLPEDLKHHRSATGSEAAEGRSTVWTTGVWCAMRRDATCLVKPPRSLSQPSDRGSTITNAYRNRSHPRRSSFSYSRLPAYPLLRLSIHKLDGSSFDVQVARRASVGELKNAIEDLFVELSKDDESTISWSHVWGHFCLSNSEGKLTDDNASLRALGIKDGDQLHFVRHLSLSRGLSKRKTRSHETALQPQRSPLTGLHDDVDEKTKDRDCDGVGCSHFVEYRDDTDYDSKKTGRADLKLRSHLFRRWFTKPKTFHRSK